MNDQVIADYEETTFLFNEYMPLLHAKLDADQKKNDSNYENFSAKEKCKIVKAQLDEIVFRIKFQNKLDKIISNLKNALERKQ